MTAVRHCRGLRTALEAVVGAGHAPGAVAARIRPEALDLAAAGEAAPGEPFTAAHGVAWFSVTKLLTMTATLRAIGDGRLELDDPASRWIPEVAAGPRPTVRDLLAHRAGLPDPIPWGWLQPADAPRRDALDRAKKSLRRHAPAWWRRGAPNGPNGDPVPSYSNLSYLAVGAVLERALGVPAHEVLEATARALGLEATRCAPTAGGAAGHVPFGSAFDVAMWVGGARTVSRGRHGRWRVLGPVRMDVAAAGGAFGPIGDIAQFGRRWLTGRGLGLARELRSAAFDEPGPYALGFGRLWDRRFVHEGSGLGFVARLELDLEREVGWAVVVNRSGRRRPEWGGLERLAGAVRAAPRMLEP